MAWLLLVCAITVEVAATTALKLSAGLTRVGPAVVSIVGYLLSLGLLAQALRLRMPVSIAYAVWSGLGTAAIAVIGAVALHESLNAAKIGGIALIIAGVTVLNLAGAT